MQLQHSRAPSSAHQNDQTGVFRQHFQTLAIGRQYSPAIPGEGPIILFQPNVIEIVHGLANPNPYERQCFNANHSTRIGIARVGRLGILLFNFGAGFTCEVPFDAGIEHPESMPDLSGFTSASHITLSLVGVALPTQAVFGLRLLSMSRRVSQEFVNLVREQQRCRITEYELTQSVNAAFLKYPTFQSLVAIALANDKAGADREEEQECGWPMDWGQPEVMDSGLDILRNSRLEPQDIQSRILAGDYGEFNAHPTDYQLSQRAREAGRRFLALYKLAGGVLYCAINENGRTIFCSFEDR